MTGFELRTCVIGSDRSATTTAAYSKLLDLNILSFLERFCTGNKTSRFSFGSPGFEVSFGKFKLFKP